MLTWRNSSSSVIITLSMPARPRRSQTANEGIVGGKDGTSFWLITENTDIIEDIAKGDNRLYETLLGFDEGYLGDGPLYRLDVSPEVVAEKASQSQVVMNQGQMNGGVQEGEPILVICQKVL